MSKIISAEQMTALRIEAATVAPTNAPSPDLEALVAPTADDLMELTLAAFDDVEPQFELANEQRDALRGALKARLIAVLTGQVVHP